jgi:hypothetical protein
MLNCKKPDQDCDYFYELANLAKQYKVDLTVVPEDLASTSPTASATSSGKVKDIEFPAKKMTAE